MQQMRWVLLALCFSIAVLAAPALASVVTSQECPSCVGSVYTLTINEVSSNPFAHTDLYSAILSTDTSQFRVPVGKDAAFLSAGDFNVADDILSHNLMGAPLGGHGQVVRS